MITEGEPRSPAIKPVDVKIPAPIIFDTTSAVALTTPNCRSKVGLEDAVADATSRFILG
jgi:hypothetical protein